MRLEIRVRYSVEIVTYLSNDKRSPRSHSIVVSSQTIDQNISRFVVTIGVMMGEEYIVSSGMVPIHEYHGVFVEVVQFPVRIKTGRYSDYQSTKDTVTTLQP